MFNRLKQSTKRKLISAGLGITVLTGAGAATTGIVPIKIGQIENPPNAQAASGSCYRRDTWWNSPAVCRFYPSGGVSGASSTGGSGFRADFYASNGNYVGGCNVNTGSICDLNGYRATQIKITNYNNLTTSYFNTF